MKSFKQFIREQEELEESRLAKTMLGLAMIGGLQAGAMRQKVTSELIEHRWHISCSK